MRQPLSRMMKLLELFLIAMALTGTVNASGVSPLPPKTASEIQHMLGKLQVLGSVMYLAAHPDDENTHLIAHLAKEKGYRTVYLSLTRGGGGQNLIGSEKGADLGILRTQEMLAARRIDGAEQWFTRAYDFGYSKSAEETLRFWNREEVLADIVWAIRHIRPDVVITRFPSNGGGHGHHTASAILANEAFLRAADPKSFPEQLTRTDVWRPERLLWNRSRPPQLNDRHLRLKVGGYIPLLGKSTGEIAGESRSMHRCQAMGTTRSRSLRTEILEHKIGEPARQDLFDGIDTTWSRIDNGKPIGDLLSRAYEEFNPQDPSTVVPLLLKAHTLLANHDDAWAKFKRRELERMIAYCCGLWFEFRSPQSQLAQGNTTRIQFQAVNRSNISIRLMRVGLSGKTEGPQLNPNQQIGPTVRRFDLVFQATDAEPTQPFWLVQAPKNGMYSVEDSQLIGRPESPPAVEGAVTFDIGGRQIRFSLPVVHFSVDPSLGEVYQPFVITPPVTVTPLRENVVFASREPREVSFRARNHGLSKPATINFQIAEGWKVDPPSISLRFSKAGEEQVISVQVTPPENQQSCELGVRMNPGEEKRCRGYRKIHYSHIPLQVHFPATTVRLLRIDLKKQGQRLAYIMGAGDDVPDALRQIGYQVDLLKDQEIARSRLQEYDAVIAGVRVYNVNERMPFHQTVLLDYVENGGRFLVQYNTSWGITTSQPGPFPLNLSRDRVTVENAPVKFLEPDHPILQSPNRITQADFKGWVQERGLYFPNRWDDRYTPLLSMHDPGERDLSGALLVAKHGKGYFIYTGLSLFRQLPAGVPGAYRLMANLLSIE